MGWAGACLKPVVVTCQYVDPAGLAMTIVGVRT